MSARKLWSRIGIVLVSVLIALIALYFFAKWFFTIVPIWRFWNVHN